MTAPALTVTGLTKSFLVGSGHGRRTLTAVEGLNLEIRAGETVALIGESGSGKSTAARCIAHLVKPTAGQIVLNGQDLSRLPPRRTWRAYRQLQMVFQDPASSLNPRMTVRAAIEEPLRVHSRLSAQERRDRVSNLIEQVGLRQELADRHPRQLSGGECQRVSIARALAVEPSVLLLDEPTASLDVSVRRHIIELLTRLQDEHSLAYLFISHDLSTVRGIADQVLVMYLGSIVERGTVQEVFGNPTHPYTRALLDAEAMPEYGRSRTDRFRLTGELTTALAARGGCQLAPRCPLRQPSCVRSAPAPTALSPTHVVRCPITAARTGGDQTRKEDHAVNP